MCEPYQECNVVNKPGQIMNRHMNDDSQTSDSYNKPCPYFNHPDGVILFDKVPRPSSTLTTRTFWSSLILTYLATTRPLLHKEASHALFMWRDWHTPLYIRHKRYFDTLSLSFGANRAKCLYVATPWSNVICPWSRYVCVQTASWPTS